jgi:hypothetical protein
MKSFFAIFTLLTVSSTSQAALSGIDCPAGMKTLVKCYNEELVYSDIQSTTVNICQKGALYHFVFIDSGNKVKVQNAGLAIKGEENKYFYGQDELMISIAVSGMRSSRAVILNGKFEVLDLNTRKSLVASDIKCDRY